MKRYLLRIFIVLVMLSMYSCINLKPYERVYVNDPQMLMDMDAGKNFENYVHSIREGAIPAGTKKSSGGCGCN